MGIDSSVMLLLGVDVCNSPCTAKFNCRKTVADTRPAVCAERQVRKPAPRTTQAHMHCQSVTVKPVIVAATMSAAAVQAVLHSQWLGSCGGSSNSSSRC